MWQITQKTLEWKKKKNADLDVAVQGVLALWNANERIEDYPRPGCVLSWAHTAYRSQITAHMIWNFQCFACQLCIFASIIFNNEQIMILILNNLANEYANVHPKHTYTKMYAGRNVWVWC